MINNVTAATPGTTPDSKATDLDKLKEVAKKFEAVFARQMFKSMREAKLSDDDLFGSDATDQFRDMQDSNIADQFAGQGALGLGDLLVKQFQARVGKGAATATTDVSSGPKPLTMPVRASE
jgi:flagellar protein FlgJ